jgi:amino acid permease
MIKKWVIAAIAYLLVVIIGFTIYSSTVDPEPMNMNQKESNDLIVGNN